MRLFLAWLAAAGVGAGGALILGEYPFSGLAVLASGAVLGLFVAEAAVAVARRPRGLLGAGCAGIAAAAMTWSAWIASGHDLSFLKAEGWMAVALAAGVAGLRGWWTRPAPDSSARAPAPAE